MVGGVFNTINPSVYEGRKNPIKEKLAYSQKDMEDWSKTRGLKIIMPEIFPVNSVKAMRGAFYFLEEGNIEIKIRKTQESQLHPFPQAIKDIPNILKGL